MTTVKQIDSAKSTKHFTLFKKVLVYKCYNQDAMVFVHRVKKYKMSSKYVKSVAEDVCSVGFPDGEVEDGDLTLKYTSSVIDMSRMFANAQVFNQAIGKWDTSNVIGMAYKVINAIAFNQNISPWYVTKITSRPIDFDTSVKLGSAFKPIWGTYSQ